MSAKNRGSEVEPNEFYETPSYSIYSFLDANQWILNYRSPWFEPAFGLGQIPKCVDKYIDYYNNKKYLGNLEDDIQKPTWDGLDIEKRENFKYEPVKFFHQSILDYNEFDKTNPRYEIAITNPGFSLSVEYVKRILAVSHWFFMLGRVGLLESDKRYEFWQEYPASHIDILAERPRFKGNTSDNAAYAWYTFSRYHSLEAPTTLKILPKWDRSKIPCEEGRKNVRQ